MSKTTSKEVGSIREAREAFSHFEATFKNRVDGT